MGNWISSEQENFPLTTRKTKKYGWKPDFPDNRDIMVSFVKDMVVKTSIDLRTSPCMPDIYNQGSIGSCTGNALAAIFEFEQRKQSLPDFMPSRLFIYFNERVIEHTVHSDSGATIRDGIKTLNRIGVCPEHLHPYIEESFDIKPTQEAYKEAHLHKALNYRRIQINVDDLVKILSSEIPVVFGFSVYESFESDEVARTGVMPMPKRGEKIIGGHAVAAVGFNAARKIILVRNSWGTKWGQNGYFTMPYEFFTSNNCADAWIIQKVKKTVAAVVPMIQQPTSPLDELDEQTEDYIFKEE